MFELFKQYISDKVTLSGEEFSRIEKVCLFKKLRKRQYLLQEGDICKHNIFVCKGFLRTYFIDGNGNEHTMGFAIENHWAGDRESLMTGLPSKYNIDAVEHSEVILIRKTDFDDICKSIPVFNDLVNTILQRSFVVAQQRIHVNITYSAEEKYHYFISHYPTIANRVPLHMIASYLGMSPETISRIRKSKV